MCGVVGLFTNGTFDESLVRRMCDDVAHRGPDDAGVAYFGGPAFGVIDAGAEGRPRAALGHRRLSILDLSVAGRCPMTVGGRLWITYNGEVYNYLELRTELEGLGHRFFSDTDTEVVLRSYDAWGTGCFRRFRGMWGLIIVDLERKCAVLSRDRLGIKPLYMARADGLLAVASELKQFRHVPGFALEMDRAAGSEHLRTGYEDPTRTFFRGITPLPGGTWATVSLDGALQRPPTSFWDPERIQVSITSAEEAGRAFRDVFDTSVDLHFRSDVPVGCALSGGLDSSAIVATSAGRSGASALATFTARFPGYRRDERPYVEAMVERFPVEPHEVFPTPERFLEDLDDFVWAQDEPVSGLSIYAGYALARLTREQGVPVSLNGQGGDEVLGGYWQSYAMHLRSLSRSGRAELATELAGSLLPGGNSGLIVELPRLARRYVHRRFPIELVPQESETRSSMLADILDMDDQQRRVHEMRVLHLPRLLRWDDRNLMAFSVEGRYPFLDDQLIEVCLRMSPQALYSRGWTKVPLRKALGGRLPPQIHNRRTKWGFATPQDDWLRGVLSPVLDRWLTTDRPVWDFADRRQVQELVTRFRRPAPFRAELGQQVFRVFVFDRWMERFGLSG